MKSNLYNHIFFISIIVALLFNINGMAQQNDLSNYRTRFGFKTVKQADNSRLLEVTFKALNKKNRKDQLPLYEAEIQFFNVFNDEEILLGSSKTSNEGIAQLILPENQKYSTDAEGYINLRARFNATDALGEEEKDIMVKDLHFTLNLTEIDSVQTVSLTAFTIDSFGVKTPVSDVYITTYVKAMLSKKIINEGIISDGAYKFKMTQNFAGDTKGNLTISSIIDGNDEYANVIQEKTVHWGTFNKQLKQDKNMLWTKVAPIWMYIVLTILLLGVWVNYFFTIVNLFIIKKEGNNIVPEPKKNYSTS
jgi:hypothetical protein